MEESTEAFYSDPLWIDLPDAPTRIEQLSCSQEVKNIFQHFHKHGYAILRSAISSNEVDDLVNEFRNYAANHPDSDSYNDEYGFHERLTSFHLVSVASSKLYLHKVVQEFLYLLFDCRPQIVGSLFFEKGSEQAPHRDTPAFFTNPLNQYVGIWHALEDIGEEQGPLIYFSNSHRIIGDIELRKQFTSSDPYQEELNRICIESGCEAIEFHAKKGDILIWHPQLVHGGQERKNPQLSRLSMVFHWKSSKSSIHPPTLFFSGNDSLPRNSIPYIQLEGGVEAIDQSIPRFRHNKKNGNFTETA